MDIQEIIDLLEKAKTKLAAIEIRTKARPYVKDKGDKPVWVMARGGFECIDQALTLLKQQPKATSIGNKIREIASKDILGQTKLVRDKDILNQAADRLDAWWKYINELKEEVDLLKQQSTAGDFTKEVRPFINKKLEVKTSWLMKKLYKACDIIDRAEAINKDLLVALEKYGRHGVVGGDICEKSKHSDYNCTCGFEAAKAKQ